MSRFIGDNLNTDVGRPSGALFIAPQDFSVLTNAVITRNAVGDVSANTGSILTATLTYAISPQYLRRVLALEGGLAADGTNLVTGDASIAKGIKITDITMHYQISGVNLTSQIIRMDRIFFVDNVANSVVPVLANAANGLATAFRANPYTTKIPIVDPVHPSGYAISDNSSIYLELAVVTPAASTYRFYGCTLHVTFNNN